MDFDLKSGTYPSKEAFIESLSKVDITPTKIIDSGGGIHVYWKVLDLDAKSYLRLSRRLCRLYKTDEAVGQIFQLMRLPGFNNTKIQGNPRPCELLYETEATYTCEELSLLLPPLSIEDEQFCEMHYNKTYGLYEPVEISDKIPAKFGKLIKTDAEAAELYKGQSKDRSKADYRLGHLLFANGFTRDEALSVLVNSAKALERAPSHRASYAQNIVDKIWTFEEDSGLTLSSSVEDILKKSSGSALKGTRLPCNPLLDSTDHGFRLGQVLGLVGGSGIGKTAFALNMFKWFVANNPDYDHFFVPLEQPANEIADRWSTMCGEDKALHKKVHVISNYDEDGNFRHLSFSEIKEYIERWQKKTGKKIGCVVTDHIGALKKKGSNDENQDLMTICHEMKAFAVQTNTFLIMQSQTSREKAGIGDLELDKDAAYGTSTFEWYCDYLVTIWQPAKRMHSNPACPTVTAFKYCKIRHKKPKKDIIQEDVPYYLYFDSTTETLRSLTQDEKQSFKYFLPQAVNKRRMDKKTDIQTYQSVPLNGESQDAGS